MTAMKITIHSTFLDFEVRNEVAYGGMRWSRRAMWPMTSGVT